MGKTTGSAYEARAAVALQDAGMVVLRRNFRCFVGEIDLICRDGETLVFVEVRARRRGRHASAAASVTPHKQRKLIRAAQVFLQQSRLAARCRCRFDVVAFDTGGQDGTHRMQWLKNAFTM